MLDEATSALDGAAEQLLYAQLLYAQLLYAQLLCRRMSFSTHVLNWVTL